MSCSDVIGGRTVSERLGRKREEVSCSDVTVQIPVIDEWRSADCDGMTKASCQCI